MSYTSRQTLLRTAARAKAAEWLQKLIAARSTTINEVAALSGLASCTIRGVLRGRTAELRTLERIATALDVQVPEALRELAYRRHDWLGLRQQFPSEFLAFSNMHRRVSDPRHPDYPSYGGVGIKIHPDWKYAPEGFSSFLRDLGSRPTVGHSIHRSPPSANYGPKTCRWEDAYTQNIEKRSGMAVELNGELMGRAKFEQQAAADGFLFVVHRHANGSLKERRHSKQNGECRTDKATDASWIGHERTRADGREPGSPRGKR